MYKWMLMDALEISNYAGLTATGLLTLNILLGLLLSTRYNPTEKWPHKKINIFQIHNWTGYAALCVALLHPFLILFSKTAGFHLLDLLYPVHSPVQPLENTLGALALYTLILVVVTSHFRAKIGFKIWKKLHYLAYASAIASYTHGILTDPNLKNTPLNPLDAEKLFVELSALTVLVGSIIRIRYGIKNRAARKMPSKILICGLLSLAAALVPVISFAQERPTETSTESSPSQAHAGSSTPTQKDNEKQGYSYDPDAGFVYQKSDFKWTVWGYGERILNPDGENLLRRVRQGMEFDLPRFSESLRPTFVYEVDFTNNDFFKQNKKWKVFENLFVALQNPVDPSAFRVLVGENTHILSREDNLSSGNLPTINRSLILEEHGSVKSFGTQFGVQAIKSLSPSASLALSAQDNRGSLNQDEPRYTVGDSLAAKFTGLGINNTEKRKKLTYGIGVDYTKKIGDQIFAFATPIGGQGLGGIPASGDKLTCETDLAFTFPLLGQITTLEVEGLYSSFSKSHSNVGGGYAQYQVSLFDTDRFGDLDPFIRYDFVNANLTSISDYAFQDAYRAGVNYNLPYSKKRANLHLEYAQSHIRGSSALVPDNRTVQEFRIELRVSLTRYIRH